MNFFFAETSKKVTQFSFNFSDFLAVMGSVSRFAVSLLAAVLFSVGDSATSYVRIILSNSKSYSVGVTPGVSKTSSVIRYGHPVSKVQMQYFNNGKYTGDYNRVTIEWGGLFVQLMKI